MDHQRLTRNFLRHDPSRIGQPVVGMDNIKILLRRYRPCHHGVAGNFFHQVCSVFTGKLELVTENDMLGMFARLYGFLYRSFEGFRVQIGNKIRTDFHKVYILPVFIQIRILAHHFDITRINDFHDALILITSGLDGKYPKGIPVARVISVAPSNYTEFMTIYAEPLVDMQHIEEVMLLEPTGIVKPPMADTPDPVFVGPPLPSSLLPKQKDASSSREQPAQGHQRGF